MTPYKFDNGPTEGNSIMAYSCVDNGSNFKPNDSSSHEINTIMGNPTAKISAFEAGCKKAVYFSGYAKSA